GGAASGAGDREPGLRACPEPGRRRPAALQQLRALGDRRPLGRDAGARRSRRGVLCLRRPRPRRAGAHPRGASLARKPPGGRLRLAAADGGARLMAATRAPIDKRRNILDAAVRVFARQGFHSTRVSDIADEAGVAYGLVYHYFDSKEEVLNELF